MLIDLISLESFRGQVNPELDLAFWKTLQRPGLPALSRPGVRGQAERERGIVKEKKRFCFSSPKPLNAQKHFSDGRAPFLAGARAQKLLENLEKCIYFIYI